MKDKIIRSRIAPKIWDATYILTRENLKVFLTLIEILRESPVDTLKVLDLGCGYQPFSHIFLKENFEFNYIGVDFNSEVSEPDFVLNLNTDSLPFDDNQFDVIILSEVLEHLYDPKHCLKEAKRVLKSGGFMYVSTPFIFPYHGTPHDYYRFTEFFYEKIANELSLEYIKIKKSGSFYSTPFFVVNIALDVTFSKLKLTPLTKPIIAFNNLMSLFLDYVIDKIFKFSDISSKIHYMNCGISVIFRKCAE